MEAQAQGEHGVSAWAAQVGQVPMRVRRPTASRQKPGALGEGLALGPNGLSLGLA